MGIAFKELIVGKEIEIVDLKGKILAVDTSNILYQFLASIRARDGSLLQDSHGNVTSHLQGLLLRVTNLLSQGVKLCFVLDGRPPDLKREERERRREIKKEAEKKYKIAEKRRDLEGMRKYAARTITLTSELVEESVKLLNALGLPVIQSPSEAEAQAAFLVKNKDAYATASQDYDSLMHGTLKLVRNLSIAGRRKKAGTLGHSTVKPELVSLSETLNRMGVDQNQLIAVAMLIGTDYNVGGVKGIGPVNAIKLVKQHGSDFDGLFNEVRWNNFFDVEWTEVYHLIKKMPVKKDYEIKWGSVDKETVIRLLCDKHDFSEERVSKAISKLIKGKEDQRQMGLDRFIQPTPQK